MRMLWKQLKLLPFPVPKLVESVLDALEERHAFGPGKNHTGHLNSQLVGMRHRIRG